MNQVMLQLTLAVAMFTTTVVVGLLPLKLQKPGLKKSRLQSLLSCFAGGVFLGTSFLDIFPHVNETYARLRGRMGLEMSYPFPELFCCLGFFLVYLLEEVTLKIFGGHGHGHGDEENKYTSVSQEPHVEEPAAKIARGRHDTDVEERHEEKENGRLSRSSMHGSHQVVANTHELFVEEYANAQSSTDDEGGLLRSITFAAAISFHSILEGFALGIQENITGIVTLFISLLFDKGIEAFSVGLQISRSNRKRVMFVVITIITYALMTPVGAMIGVALQEVDMDANLKDAVMVVLEGLAGGTFVYITFFEVLSQERENDVSNLYQLAAIVCGFSVIASLQANEHFEILFA